MKNQYVGDVGDFGKYSLLQAFLHENVKVGVNWYLTKDDGSTDGTLTNYLEKEEYRRLNEKLFSFLGEIAFREDKCVGDIENGKILPKALFYTEILTPSGLPEERATARKMWFEKSRKKMSKADLVFLDPDNGLLASNDPKKLKAEKYVLPDEVKSYFADGSNVVYYCHRGRRNEAKWTEYKRIMFDMVPEARSIVLTFHRGTQRSYVFMIHERDYEKYRRIVDAFLEDWKGVFTEETI